jgi:hypothetical protein
MRFTTRAAATSEGPVPLAAAGPAWSAILEVQDPDGTRTRHPFRHPRMAVGRERDNDLSLADEGISHRHCEFVSERGFFVVRDLGSQNGTFVNERRVSEARLREGDAIRIGETRILLEMQGDVRRPDRRSRARPLGVVLGLVAAGAAWLWLGHEQQAMRAAYAAALRDQLAGEACAAPQFQELEAADARLAGRSFALTLGKGGVQLSKEDLALDRELQSIYRRKLAPSEAAYRALVGAQEQRRSAAEKLARAGQRLWTSRERKTAAWIDGLLQERARAVDQLLLAVRRIGDDTAQLTASVDALLATKPDPQAAEHLRSFRFHADLRAARAACEEQEARVTAGLAGALTALSE